MKKYLFIALAALGFAACAEKIDDTNAPVQNGELEESYIAINLMSADVDTRAPLNEYGGFEEGTAAERAIETAYFFFFDDKGDAFNVNATPKNPATSPGDVNGVNHLSLNISDATTPGMPNVSDITEAVLVLNTYKGIYPSQIVAVLNWTPEANEAYDLDELHEMLATIGNDNNGYVMSNSVYMDGAKKIVDAVPVTTENIKTSAADALDKPIDIYVERVAAKVVLTASGKVTNDNIFKTDKNPELVGSENGTLVGASNAIDVYVKLHGWELYNDYSTSTLLKNINTSWDVTTLGLTWNDIPYFRCYWAQSQATSQSDAFAWSYSDDDKAAKGFQTNYGFNVGASANYTDRTTYTYCGENTNQKDGTTDPRTKVILKGQLMQKNGDKYEPLELARWYGTEYAGEDALKIAVANSLKHTVFSSADQTQYDPITPGDLECVAGENVGAKDYEVGFQLSTDGAAKTWYKYSSEKGYESFGDIANNVNRDKTNAHLKTVEPALLYAEGNTYYIVDIEHLGTAGAKFGVVRNHVYQIDIKSIKGYGSPIYNGLSFIVDQPEYPIEDEGSYVAAKINVLSWKVVKQQVNVGE